MNFVHNVHLEAFPNYTGPNNTVVSSLEQSPKNTVATAPAPISRSSSITSSTKSRGTFKAKRVRTVFTSKQLTEMEREFQLQNYLCRPTRIAIADHLGPNECHVKTWFQNRRMKSKKAANRSSQDSYKSLSSSTKKPSCSDNSPILINNVNVMNINQGINHEVTTNMFNQVVLSHQQTVSSPQNANNLFFAENSSTYNSPSALNSPTTAADYFKSIIVWSTNSVVNITSPVFHPNLCPGSKTKTRSRTLLCSNQRQHNSVPPKTSQ